MISKELFCKTIADIQEDVARIPPQVAQTCEPHKIKVYGRRMRYDMPTAESLYDYLTLPFEQLPLEVES